MMNEPRTAQIILIDDHDDSREVVGAWLRSEGFDVLEFERAQPALDALMGNPCAEPSWVVVTDLTLPGMTGAELAARIRADGNLGHLPIIALTGHGDVAFGPGELFDDLIVKPFDPDELVAAVSRLSSDNARVSRTVTRISQVPRTSSSG